MGSSSQSRGAVYDPIRAMWVAARPEELVRQKLIQQMIGPLGYRRAYIVIEKKLEELPHLLYRPDLPKRRIDLLAFASLPGRGKEMAPLLLVECKEKRAEEEALRQLLGYNSYVCAPFLALADEAGVRFFYRAGEGLEELSFLPPYKELISALCG